MNDKASEYKLLVRVSWLYYMEELTQKEIGDRLGLSRIKVNRLLQQARQEGIVEININGASSTYIDLEHGLCSRYGLRDAVVIDNTAVGEMRYRTLAQGVADWLASRLEQGTIVGLSIGRTVSHLPSVFKVEQPVDCTFVEIMGGAASHTGSFEQYNVVSQMSELAGGRASYFYAPTIVSSPQVRQTLLNEESVKQAFETALSCHITIQSAGSVVDGALVRQYGYITDDELAILAEQGVVGDILCQYVDKDGNPMSSSLDGRVMSITLENLKQIPWSVGVGGIDKLDVIHAAVKAKIFNVLVTDQATAQALLQSNP